MITHFGGAYRFLSNFYPSSIQYGRYYTYPTVEHAFQAAKTRESEWEERIRNASTAAQAKALGRRAPIRPDWDVIKRDVMKECLRLKFPHGSELAGELLTTLPHDLIEGNTWGDTYWGVCHGKGENWLGFLLMDRRQELHLLS